MNLGRSLFGAFVGLVTSFPVAAQDFTPDFYYLHVGVGFTEGPLSEAGAQSIQRLRAMLVPSFGSVRVHAAYEQTFTLSSMTLGQGSGLALGVSSGGTDWLPLQGTLEEGEHFRWTHRLDRLAVEFASGAWDLVVGRQTISYATTLFLTPTDPFVPFDPADPFRTYRAGVDALRLRVFPGTFTTLEGVVRVAEAGGDTLLTALGRIRSDVAGIEFSAYGGVVHDDGAGALGVTVTEFGAAFRGEAQVRRADGETVWRLAVGADRSFTVDRKTLYLALEYQRDGFGAASATDLTQIITSQQAQRGELQVLGRHSAALSGSYQVHPLATVQLLALTNLSDPSVLLSPAASYSASATINLLGGLFVGLGDEFNGMVLGSEYGNIPWLAYVSLEGFF